MKTTLLVYPRAGAGIIMHPAGLLSLWSWYIFLTVPNLKEESIFPGRYHRVRVWKVSKANIRILKTDFIFKIIQVNRSLTGEAITAFKPQRSSQLSYWLWKFSFNTSREHFTRYIHQLVLFKMYGRVPWPFSVTVYSREMACCFLLPWVKEAKWLLNGASKR
jgi:hypothetical protein